MLTFALRAKRTRKLVTAMAGLAAAVPLRAEDEDVLLQPETEDVLFRAEDVLQRARAGGKRLENASRFPRHGWMVPLDHKFPERRNQRIRPRLGQLPQLMPLFMRPVTLCLALYQNRNSSHFYPARRRPAPHSCPLPELTLNTYFSAPRIPVTFLLCTSGKASFKLPLRGYPHGRYSSTRPSLA